MKTGFTVQINRFFVITFYTNNIIVLSPYGKQFIKQFITTGFTFKDISEKLSAQPIRG